MIRPFAIAAALVCLSACAEGAQGNAWYQQGDANYDAIKSADDACKARGGTFQLKKGGEPSHLGDFECAMPPKSRSGGQS